MATMLGRLVSRTLHPMRRTQVFPVARYLVDDAAQLKHRRKLNDGQHKGSSFTILCRELISQLNPSSCNLSALNIIADPGWSWHRKNPSTSLEVLRAHP
jgi:hypothetical protein